MIAVLFVLALVAVAYLVAHFVMEKLQHRYFFTTGGEYVLLGVLVGPVTPWLSVVDEAIIRQLAPLMSLAIGWMGLLYGMQLDLRKLLMARDGAVKLSIVAGLTTLVLVSAVSWLALQQAPLRAGPEATLLASVLLGAAAAVSAPSALDLVRSRFDADGPLTRTLSRALQLDELTSILLFGSIFCVFNEVQVDLERDLTPAEWLLISLALGAVLGILFRLFLGEESDPDKQFLALVGIIVFASGTAHYLELSPLLVNLVLGVVLVNVADDSEAILAVLERTAQPMYIVLLLFAGAMWAPVPWWGWVFAALFVLVRIAAKMLGGLGAAIALGPDTRRDIGRGMLAQGGVAVAMALNFKLVYEGPLIGVAFTAVLLSVVANELWSARLLKGLLIDAGDIQHGAEGAADAVG